MSAYGTCGDEITLRAAAEFFNIKSIINFTLRRASEAIITQQNFSPQGHVYSGHLTTLF